MKDEIKLKAVETSDPREEHARRQAEIEINEVLSQEKGPNGIFDDIVKAYAQSCQKIFSLEGVPVVGDRLKDYPQRRNPQPLEVYRDPNYWKFILCSNWLWEKTGLVGKDLMDAIMVGGLNASNSRQVVEQYKNEQAPNQGEESRHRGKKSHGFFHYGKK